MFMDANSIRECILSLKIKNSEGYDRIPQRVLVDGVDRLAVAFEGLFKLLHLLTPTNNDSEQHSSFLCQAYLLANLLNIPLMYNLVFWKNYLI